MKLKARATFSIVIGIALVLGAWVYCSDNNASNDKQLVSSSVSPSPADPVLAYGLTKTDEARFKRAISPPASPVPFNYLQYCTPLSSMTDLNKESLEGKLAFEQRGRFKLLQVFMLARHGDRTPTYSFPSLFGTPRLNCTLPDMWDDSTLLKTKGFKIKHLDEPEAVIVPLLGARQKKLQRNQTCDIGSLTRRGHEQQFALGHHFRQAYMKWFREPRLAPNWTDFAFVHCTEAQRTIYSTASFLLGFLPQPPRFRNSVPIHVSKGISLHGVPHRTKLVYRWCKQLSSVTAEKVSSKELKAGHSFYSIVLDRVAAALGVTKGKLPSKVTQLFDQIMVRMCHNLTVRCDSEKCVDTALISELADYAEWAKAQVFPNTTAVLMMQPFVYNTLFQHVNKAIVSDRLGRSDYLKFLLHFCHDTTLSAFLTSMSAPRRRWLPYAARVVLELWKKKLPASDTTKDAYYVRLLFNGQPITSELQFDSGDFERGQELLKFTAWSKYITTGKYRTQESYDALCGLAPP